MSSVSRAAASVADRGAVLAKALAALHGASDRPGEARSVAAQLRSLAEDVEAWAVAQPAPEVGLTVSASGGRAASPAGHVTTKPRRRRRRRRGADARAASHHSHDDCIACTSNSGRAGGCSGCRPTVLRGLLCVAAVQTSIAWSAAWQPPAPRHPSRSTSPPRNINEVTTPAAAAWQLLHSSCWQQCRRQQDADLLPGAAVHRPAGVRDAGAGRGGRGT